MKNTVQVLRSRLVAIHKRSVQNNIDGKPRGFTKGRLISRASFFALARKIVNVVVILNDQG